MIDERFELALNRIKDIRKNCEVDSIYKDYFEKTADVILMILGSDNTEECNKMLYADILPENYGKSYGNPAYCAKIMPKMTDAVNNSAPGNPCKSGDLQDSNEKNGQNKGLLCKFEISQMLCFLFSEFRGLISYAFEDRYYQDDMCKQIIVLYMELFIETYVIFSDAHADNRRVKPEALHEVIYWFNSDNCDIISPYRIREQLDPGLDYATNIIMNENLFSTDYLYKYGEYVTNNEIEVSKYLAKMDQNEIDKMASTYTEGYRIGFIKAGKPLHKKTTVNIRYNLGFERVVKAAIGQFQDMGLKPVIYRAGSLSLTKSGINRIGYTGAIPNKQYDYDHREDVALYLDKDFVNRKTGVIKDAYEDYKEFAAGFAGPAVMEVFGEDPFSPDTKSECIKLDSSGRKNQVEMSSRLSQITNQYIKGEERSFTIIAYPIPEIGEYFNEIFADTVRLNNLDYKRYEAMQQIIIDELDKSVEVRIEGKGTNRTKLTVKTHEISDKETQTVFENCVADVNIPVGEVFTSPVLKGTNGILNVSEVYLFGLNYIDLCITFKDGMIADYSCKNFNNEEENKKYIRENILHNHETLPIGEFAIGTNTTAYKMARKYHIEERMPILIGEKTGPHFAVGDTCYSHEEDVKVYNPDGKEIIARDNEITAKYRNSDPLKAYYNCHTDITIPYDELAGIYSIHEDGTEIAIIEDGRFALKGLEELNESLD